MPCYDARDHEPQIIYKNGIDPETHRVEVNQLRDMNRKAYNNEQEIGNHPDKLQLVTEYLHQSEIDDFNLAFFDARVFQIPDKEEVVNLFLWRQQDAEKNSIAMLAQSLYSHKELMNKHGGDMQEMCFQKGHNWKDLHFSKKRGSFIVKNTYVNGFIGDADNTLPDDVVRTKWEVVETPYFGKERNSILKFL